VSEAVIRFAAYLDLSDKFLARAEREDLGGVRKDFGGAMRPLSVKVRKVADLRRSGRSQQRDNE